MATAKYRQKSTPVFHSLFSPDLIMGGEKQLVVPVIGVVLILLIQGQTWLAVIFSIALLSIALPIFRQMATYDPQLALAYMRSIKQKKFYEAASTIYVYPKTASSYNLPVKH